MFGVISVLLMVTKADALLWPETHLAQPDRHALKSVSQGDVPALAEHGHVQQERHYPSELSPAVLVPREAGSLVAVVAVVIAIAAGLLLAYSQCAGCRGPPRPATGVTGRQILERLCISRR